MGNTLRCESNQLSPDILSVMTKQNVMPVSKLEKKETLPGQDVCFKKML